MIIPFRRNSEIEFNHKQNAGRVCRVTYLDCRQNLLGRLPFSRTGQKIHKVISQKNSPDANIGTLLRNWLRQDFEGKWELEWMSRGSRLRVPPFFVRKTIS